MNQRTASTLGVPGYQTLGGSPAVPLGDDASNQLNRALVTVLTYYLATGFALTTSETDSTTECLQRLLDPLRGRERSHIPIAVVHELATGQYQASLDDHAAKPITHHHPGLKSARLADWVDMLLRLIGETYRLDPGIELTLTGQLAAVLRQLGISADDHGRGSQYLPTMVLDILTQRTPDSL